MLCTRAGSKPPRRPIGTMSDVEHAAKPTNIELVTLVHACRPQPHHPCSLSQPSRTTSKQTRRISQCGSQAHPYTAKVNPHQLHVHHSGFGGPGGVNQHQAALWKQQGQHGRPRTPPCGCHWCLLQRRWRRRGDSSAASSATSITWTCAQASHSTGRTPWRRYRSSAREETTRSAARATWPTNLWESYRSHG